MQRLKPKLNNTLIEPRLRTSAEAAYLVNPQVLNPKNNRHYPFKEHYDNIINNSRQFSALKEYGYQFLEITQNPIDGFYAAAFQNREGETLVAIRGTDFSDLFDPYHFSINFIIAKMMGGDLSSDLQIALGRIPTQYESAALFIARMLKTRRQDSIIITGHSLGGLLAQLVAVKFNLAAIAFDSPGAGAIIGRLGGPSFESVPIKIFNVLPNFINTCGQHLTLPVAINNGGQLTLDIVSNLLGTLLSNKQAGADNYLFSHSMHAILNSINNDGIFKHIPITTWPKDWASFYLSITAYKTMPHIYDRYIYQLWETQYRHNLLDKYAFPVNQLRYLQKGKNSCESEQLKVASSLLINKVSFRTQYPNFTSYKNDFLKYGLVKD